MKNLAKDYLEKTSKHLFTKDGKTFMKVIPIETSAGMIAVKIQFGENPDFGAISINISPAYLYNVTSSAGKEYLSPHLKWSLFPQWGERSYSVKGGKKFQDLFDKVAGKIDINLDYSDYKVRNAASDKIRDFVEKKETESFWSFFKKAV